MIDLAIFVDVHLIDRLKLGKRRMTGPARITIDGEGAEAYSHWWIAEIHDTPGVYSTGTYTDRLRREDGRWLITERRLIIDPNWRGEPPPSR